MVYANKSWFVEHLNITRLNSLGYDFWYALWPGGNIDFSNKIQIANSGIYPLIWQYTSSGSVDGANTNSGRVDLNVMYMKEQVKLTFVSDGQVVEEKGIDKNSSTTFPEVSKKGYSFVKWIDSNGNTLTEQTKFNSNTTITAVYELGGYQKGDVNRDGKVNVSDVLYTMNKYMKGILTDEEKVIAEVTGDGKVNMNDVYRILAYAMGKISSL